MGKLSAAYFDQDSGFGGDDVMLVNGYSDLIKGLLSFNGNAPLKIAYGQQVSAVDSSNPNQITVKTLGGGTYTAAYLISTLPLGVMQQNNIVWTPGLPSNKIQAM